MPYLISFVILLCALPHEYFTSLTKVQYDSTAKQLFVKVELDAGQLSETLNEHFGHDLYLGEEEEDPDAAKMIESYFEENWSMQINGKSISFSLTDKQIDWHHAYLLFESKTVKGKPKRISLKNTLLIDQFPEQKNLVDYQFNESSFSNLFTKEKDDFEYKLK